MYHKPANVQTPDPGAKRQFLRVHLPAVKLVSSFQGGHDQLQGRLQGSRDSVTVAQKGSA
ncbi:hypothetical protein M758_4G042500 [Ceratodon purpureus]|uniref:Uncharacterized protein n=1 Tax=Ceratodon purpureus TaxID=3225 RepID=A0A8T0I6K2_CERPU|nr:hypothetical protein KC19_4G045500 [Ceratodon purpureus]KAG0618138.1 hypothetical protein M758_4G042500 [Ceratodon purpureus]